MIAINSVDPVTLVVLAAAQTAAIAGALVISRAANQWQKLLVAAFAASVAGFLLYWIGGQIGLFAIHAVGGEAAIFLLQLAFGLAWAGLGYAFRKR